jgi:hypothetical protein
MRERRIPLPALIWIGANVLVLPKLVTGHCIFHILGLNDALGFDPLHALWSSF